MRDTIQAPPPVDDDDYDTLVNPPLPVGHTHAVELDGAPSWARYIVVQMAESDRINRQVLANIELVVQEGRLQRDRIAATEKELCAVRLRLDNIERRLAG